MLHTANLFLGFLHRPLAREDLLLFDHRRALLQLSPRQIGPGLVEPIVALAQFAVPVGGLIVLHPPDGALHIGVRLAQRQPGFLAEFNERSTKILEHIDRMKLSKVSHGRWGDLGFWILDFGLESQGASATSKLKTRSWRESHWL